MAGITYTMSEPSNVRLEKIDKDALLITLAGNWVIHEEMDTGIDVEKKIQASLPVRSIAFDTSELDGWDSGLLI